jgi:hypothetical protein
VKADGRRERTIFDIGLGGLQVQVGGKGVWEMYLKRDSKGFQSDSFCPNVLHGVASSCSAALLLFLRVLEKLVTSCT